MGRPVYSTRLCFGDLTSPECNFTCPTGFVAVLVAADWVMEPADDADLAVLALNSLPVFVGTGPTVGGFVSVSYRGRLVMNPGDEMTIGSTEANGWGQASGYLLTQ